MTVFMLDISDYQGGFNFPAAVADLIGAFAIKATEGPVGYYISPNFAAQLARAQATGKSTIAYHYVRGTDVHGQANAVTAVVPKSVPVALDLESGGDIATTRALAAELRRRGWVVPLLYCPHWWWSTTGGSAPIGDIALLWSSAYPAGGGASPAGVYANAGGDNGSGWAAYGGSTPVAWQFTDALQIGAYSVDCSALKGTSAQIAAQLAGGTTPTPGDIVFEFICDESTTVSNPFDPKTGFKDVRRLVGGGMLETCTWADVQAKDKTYGGDGTGSVLGIDHTAFATALATDALVRAALKNMSTLTSAGSVASAPVPYDIALEPSGVVIGKATPQSS